MRWSLPALLLAATLAGCADSGQPPSPYAEAVTAAESSMAGIYADSVLVRLELPVQGVHVVAGTVTVVHAVTRLAGMERGLLATTVADGAPPISRFLGGPDEAPSCIETRLEDLPLDGTDALSAATADVAFAQLADAFPTLRWQLTLVPETWSPCDGGTHPATWVVGAFGEDADDRYHWGARVVHVDAHTGQTSVDPRLPYAGQFVDESWASDSPLPGIQLEPFPVYSGGEMRLCVLATGGPFLPPTGSFTLVGPDGAETQSREGCFEVPDAPAGTWTLRHEHGLDLARGAGTIQLVGNVFLPQPPA